jgi:hypothetical protein
MPTSTPSASDAGSETQSASQALTALTAATADWYDAKRLLRVQLAVTQKFKTVQFTHETQGILNILNRSVMSRLREKATKRQSLLTDACEAYTYATGELPDQTTWVRPEPKQIVTQAEANQLLGVFEEARTDFVERGDLLEDISKAYKRILLDEEIEV